MNIESFPDLPDRLHRRLCADPLVGDAELRIRPSATSTMPGRWARERFAPELCYGRHFGPYGPLTRKAAVAVLFYQDGGQWRVPLTLRSGHLAFHGGQISLPGGASHAGESFQQTALREAYEEIGISPDHVTVLGQLSETYVFVSDYVVSPLVGFVSGPVTWALDPCEVSALLEVSLGELLDPANYGTQIRRRVLTPGEVVCPDPTAVPQPVEFAAPFIECQGQRIWGATAIILGEFITLIEGLAADS